MSTPEYQTNDGTEQYQDYSIAYKFDLLYFDRFNFKQLFSKAKVKIRDHKILQGGPKVTSQRFELIARPLIT